MNANDPERQAKMQQVLTRCWTDAAFRQSLIDDPKTVLAAAGIEVPANVHLVVVEDEPDRMHLVIPAAPDSEADMDAAAAAAVSYVNPAC